MSRVTDDCIERTLATRVGNYAICDYLAVDESEHWELMHAILTAAIPHLAPVSVTNDPRVVELVGITEQAIQFMEHHESCGDHDAYNHADIQSCGCGLDSILEILRAALANLEKKDG